MNIKSLLLCVTIFAAASSHGAISFDGEIPSLSEKIDLVLFNGQVKTPEGWHSAVAVGDGWIVAVGDDALARTSRQTRSILIDSMTVAGA